MLRFPDRELRPDDPDRRRLDAIAGELDVPAERVALVGSMAEYVAAALSVTPEVEDATRQGELTRKFLRPAIPALERLLLDLRGEVDPALRRRSGSKAYPLGCCSEITAAVEARLETLDPAQLSARGAEAAGALSAFLAAGGRIRRAWGDLRGQYFQTALIVGSLYVDVANDTVVITKPPVEILPFAGAGFRPIADYGHFVRIAERYWGWRFAPNHLVPQLAPYCPLIEISASGAFRLGPPGSYMTGLNLSRAFAPAERTLAGPPTPAPLFSALQRLLSGEACEIAADAGTGRAAALAACRAYRAEGRETSADAFNGAALLARRLNRRLARFKAVPRSSLTSAA